jgi:hypothetical protein
MFLGYDSTLNFNILNNESAAILFGTNNTERMRIDSSGTLILNPAGTTSPFPALDIYGATSSGTQGALRFGDGTLSAGHSNYWNIGRDNTTTGNFTFSLNGTQVSYIGGAGAYVQVSDRRLKKNIVPLQYGLSEVLALNPVMYNMAKELDTDKKHLGLIAQEVKAIIDESVDDLIDESIQFYGLDKSGLVPVLIKAIQEQQQQIEELRRLINGN